MYNDPTEIVFLINLLLQNDKRVKTGEKKICRFIVKNNAVLSKCP